ncbi:cytosine permease [mine drainage metagenome]|uniref:Cytosine permease n=1 Tax=mine drainage metagenome TaxID=410659 RepID=A0A1J5QR38_9ZZZZ
MSETTGILREGDYGTKVGTVEPGGIEEIPQSERHGSPIQLLWTWTSPNLEFATVFVGALGVLAFNLSVMQSLAAILLGNALGAAGHAFLSVRGPRYGVPQMILGRPAFGRLGNAIPSLLGSLVAGIGWFAVNSVSGAFALNTLFKVNLKVSLLIVVLIQVAIAFFGHNLIQVFERYAFPVLAVIFGIACIVSLAKSHLGGGGTGGGMGGFLLETATVYGYSAGWNPFAADYARYLPSNSDSKKVALFAGLGLFASTTILEFVGAASMTIASPKDASPTDAFVGHFPTVLAKLVLLAIIIGSIAANVLNIYSGSLSFLATGIKIPSHIRRAIVALVFGIGGFFLALSAINNPKNNYENFLLVISYWIGPWLGVIVADSLLRKGKHIAHLLFKPDYENYAGPVAFIVGVVVSIWLFSNQAYYTGMLAKTHPGIGYITFEAGFVIAFVLYWVLGAKKARSSS